MSPIDLAVLFFFFITFIKIAVDFEKHMADTKPKKAAVREAHPAYMKSACSARKVQYNRVSSIPVRSVRVGRPVPVKVVARANRIPVKEAA